METADWNQGSKKGNAKKETEAEKKAEAARKKAEREALLKEEEASLPTKPQNSKNRGADKIAARKSKGLDDFLSGIDNKESDLNVSGLDNALDALSLTNSKATGNKNDLERHPERRYKAAYIAYEERRLPEYREEHPGLRLNQYKDLIHKEFEKHPDNPFNQVHVSYDANKRDVKGKQQEVRRGVETRLAGK